MSDFTISIAELNIGISSLFSSTREYFKDYLTENPADFAITVTPEMLPREQAELDKEADELGLRRRAFTDPFLERTAIQRQAAAIALQNGTVLLHGSTVVLNGRAYLFTAKTGVGKSTHTRLWTQAFPGAYILNDDRAFIRMDGTAYGSPWSGKHGIHRNAKAPLAGICILERGGENEIRRISPEEALPEILAQMFLPAPELAPMLTEQTARLAENIPLWRMRCTREISAALIAHDAMGQDCCRGGCRGSTDEL